MNFKKVSAKVLSVFMAVMMLFGVAAPVISAASWTTSDGHVHSNHKDSVDVNYVSLGDSMTNGYGLPGYEGNAGVENYGEGSYANLFADYLAGLKGVGDVDHAQLAMSGMRAEDLHWLLELDYNNQEIIDYIASKEVLSNEDENYWVPEEWYAFFDIGDFWTLDEICDHSRLDNAYTAIVDGKGYDKFPSTVDTSDGMNRAEKVAVVAKYFQEHVTEADIISLGMGNGNFGVFMFGRIMEVIGFADTDTYMNYDIEAAIQECEPEMQEQIMVLVNDMYKVLEDKGIMDTEDKRKLVDVAVYTAVSYALNMAGSVEAMLQLNPDAEIILVGLMNTMGESGSILDTDLSAPGSLTMGDLMQLIVTPVNKFIAGVPALMKTVNNGVYKNATFYYADASSVECLAETYGDSIKSNDNVVRQRFVESIVGTDEELGMVWKLLAGVELVEGMTLQVVTLDEICAYDTLSSAEKAAAATQDPQKAISIAVYLAFEEAVLNSIDSAELTIGVLLGLSSVLGGNPFKGVMNDFASNIGKNGAAYSDDAYAVVADVLASNLEDVLNSQIKEYLENEGYFEDVNISAEITGEQVAAVMAGSDGASEAIAQNAVDSAVSSLLPVFLDMASDKAEEVFDELESLVNEKISTVPGASLEDYYEYACEEAYDRSKMPLFLAEEAENDWDGLIMYLLEGCGYRSAVTFVAAHRSLFETKIADAQEAEGAMSENSVREKIVDTLNERFDGDVIAYIASNVSASIDDPSVDAIVKDTCMLLAIPETLSASLNKDTRINGLLALFARCMIGNGLGGHPSAKGHKTVANAVIKAYDEGHTAQDETMDNILGVLNLFYVDKYAELKANGTIDQLDYYLRAADYRLDQLYELVMNYEIPADLDIDHETANKIKDLLAEEILNTDNTIPQIRDLLKIERLSRENWAELVALNEDLEAHVATIVALAEQIGIFAQPYVEYLVEQTVYWAGVVADTAVAAYEYAVAAGEVFVQAYAEFVEIAGSYADKIDPELGLAVRKYLTETPADALAIIYCYGEDAVLKFIVDASKAAEDLYIKAAGLAAVLMEHGEEIYNAVVNTDEFDALLAQIEITATALADLYVRVQNAPFSTALEYKAEIAVLEAELTALYSDLFDLVVAVADDIDPEVKGMLLDSLDALLVSMGILGDAGYDYLVYLDGHVKEMAGKLLASFLENTFEFGESTDAVIWKLLHQLNRFLMETTEKIDNQIRYQLAVLEAELNRLYEQLENAAEELKAEIEAKIAEIQAKIDELKKLIEAGIEDVKALIAEIKDLITDVNALIEQLKNNFADISLDTLYDVIESLKALDQFLSELFGEGYEELKDLLDELALKLLDRALEALKEASPYIDAYLYDYLYNHPEEVIEFFKTYGPDILELIEEYGSPVLAVIAYIIYTYGDDVVRFVIENPEETFEIISAWYNKYGYRIWPMVQVYLDALGIEYYTVDDIVAALERLYAMAEELGVQIDGYVRNELLPAIEELKANIKEQLEYIAGVAEDKLEEALAELQAMVDELKAQLTAIINDALTGEYTVTEDSYYVAITGDNSAYTELLASALGLGDKFTTMNWSDLDQDVLANADFVTLGYDESQINGFAVDQLAAVLSQYLDGTIRDTVNNYLTNVIGEYLTPAQLTDVQGMLNGYIDEVLAMEMFADKTVQDMNWAELVGEDSLNYVENALAEIKVDFTQTDISDTYIVEIDPLEYVDGYIAPKLIETIRNELGDDVKLQIEVPAVDLIMLAVESYLYSNIKFQKTYAETVLNLVAVNPDVTIAVLGQYNPFANYEYLPLADAYEVIAALASAHSFAYAVALPNVTYVDISDAETVYDAYGTEGDLLTFVMTYFADSFYLTLSEDGNRYVMDQILNAYGLACQHVYDDCEDTDCNVCGEIRVAPGHDVGHASCTEDFVCSKCGKVLELAGGHNYEEVVTAPTCTEGGYTTHTCSKCGDSYVTDEVEAAGHDYEAVVTEPTCTEGGYTTYTCKVCGDSYVADEVEAAGHDWADATCTAPKTCKVCGETEGEALGHDWADATCTAPKTCKVCGETEGDALGHKWVDATCTEAKKCSVCGATEGEALGHTYDNACDADCNVCGATRTPADHQYGDWTVVVEATEEAEGKEERTCSVCGHTETRVIPMLEKTGLGAGAIVAIVCGSVAVVAGGAAAVLFVLKKKKIFG